MTKPAVEQFESLVAAGAFADAITFLASALPSREAVGWGCICVRKYAPPLAGSPALAALEAAERWVSATDDRHRRVAFDAAEKAGFETPSAIVAAAVHFTGGSITPEGMEEAPPPEGVHAKMIAGAINICAAMGEAQTMQERYEGCLALGRRVAQHVG
jgi:hypothetical protein